MVAKIMVKPAANLNLSHAKRRNPLTKIEKENIDSLLNQGIPNSFSDRNPSTVVRNNINKKIAIQVMRFKIKSLNFTIW